MLSFFKFPKNDREFYWTSHSKSKMLQYHIFEQKIKTIIKNPARTEDGIAPKTVAVMKRNDTPKRKEELWVMFQPGSRNSTDKKIAKGDKSNFHCPARLTVPTIIISTWRYPGVSKKRDINIPEDTLAELEKIKEQIANGKSQIV